ncbi:MAG: hypothetical protein A2Z27_05110 [candidate division Zixibacteria bacterium RBG_16_50_21]|nr:MAG: hypothetical protein A2Z27_05110 [candidate division Zixibacteria bacterium RBG_16_50_21]
MSLWFKPALSFILFISTSTLVAGATGDLPETYTQVDQEFIQGKKIDLASRHTMPYEKYRIKYQQLKSSPKKFIPGVAGVSAPSLGESRIPG